MLNNKPKRIPSLVAAALIPLKLFAAGDHFYVGVNGFVNYIPEEDFKFTTWQVKDTASNVFQLDGATFKNKSRYGFGGSIAGGRMFENYMQFEAEVGADMSATLKAKSTSLNTASVDSKAPAQASSTGTANVAGAPIATDIDKLSKDATINDKDFTKTTTFYGLINGYFNFDTQGSFMPFIGVGAGVAHYKVDFTEAEFGSESMLFSHNTVTTAATTPATSPAGRIKLDDVMKDTDKNSIIFQASAGANMMVGDSLLIGAGYRFLTSAGEIELEQDGEGNSSNKNKHHMMRHNLIVSAKFLM